jgi:hypothetical protein
MNEPATETTDWLPTLTIINPTHEDTTQVVPEEPTLTALEERQSLLAHHVRLLARGMSVGLFVYGAAGGLGKSRTVLRTLAEEGVSPIVINSHVTPGTDREFSANFDRQASATDSVSFLGLSSPKARKTVSFFVCFHRGPAQTGILFLVLIERGFLYRVYHCHLCPT